MTERQKTLHLSKQAERQLEVCTRAAEILVAGLRRQHIAPNTILHEPGRPNAQEPSPQTTPESRMGWRIAFRGLYSEKASTDAPGHYPGNLLLLSAVGKILVAKVNYPGESPEAIERTFAGNMFAVARIQPGSSITPPSPSLLEARFGWENGDPIILSERIAELSGRHAISLSGEPA